MKDVPATGSSERERVWGLPWARYDGRTRSELSFIRQRFFVCAVAVWIAAAFLFTSSALGLIPGFGPEENAWAVLASLVLGTTAIMITSVWSNLDRALRGEPRVDPEWSRWSSPHGRWWRWVVQYAALLGVGALFAYATALGLTRSAPALLMTAALLILALLGWIAWDRLRGGR